MAPPANNLRAFYIAVIASLGLVGANVAFAHHSPARFLQDQVVVIEGTITQYEWKNPHVYLEISSPGGSAWLIETNPTSILRRLGWTKNSFSVGDKVFARANPNRDPGSTHVSLISIVDLGGTALEARLGDRMLTASSKTPRATGFSGTWAGEPALAFRLLFAMLEHPLTGKGSAAQEAYDESMDPVAQCVPWPTPRLVAWNAFYLIKVEMDDSIMRMESEFARATRTIYMDGRQHPTDGARSNQGHSIGWWEGETLVIDTRNFAFSRSPVADGIPGGEQKHVIERFTLINDGTAARVEITVEDPEYLAEPFRSEITWHYAPDKTMLSFDCDPEVARRFIQ